MNVKIKVFRSQELREELWYEKFNRKRSTMKDLIVTRTQRKINRISAE